MSLAFEHFTREKLRAGIEVREVDSDVRLVLHRMEDLQENVLYTREVAREVCELCAVPGGRIRFRFRIGRIDDDVDAPLVSSVLAPTADTRLFAPRQSAAAAAAAARATTRPGGADSNAAPRQLTRSLAAISGTVALL
jgi:hypothetical protein